VSGGRHEADFFRGATALLSGVAVLGFALSALAQGNFAITDTRTGKTWTPEVIL